MKGQDGKEFRPLVGEGTETMPTRQIYNGYEIEKRWVLLTMEKDHTKKQNGLSLYNKALEKGDLYFQGYIKDLDKARGIIEELGIELEFAPNTFRLRVTPTQYILTIKDKKATKRREVEWELSKDVFDKYWPMTLEHRIVKRRLTMKHSIGKEMVIDAFVDRLLLMAEIEVFEETDLSRIKDLGFDVTNQKDWSNKALSKTTKIANL
jgi:CYTH domain-containing protein